MKKQFVYIDITSLYLQGLSKQEMKDQVYSIIGNRIEYLQESFLYWHEEINEMVLQLKEGYEFKAWELYCILADVGLNKKLA